MHHDHRGKITQQKKSEEINLNTEFSFFTSIFHNEYKKF